MRDLTHDTPKPMPGAEPTPLVIKPRAYEHHPERIVHVIPHQFGKDEVEVYLPDGTWLGTVARYTGSIDTKIKGTRLRREGKRRTLWSYRTAHGSVYSMHGQTSRADCIRSLLDSHARRSRR